MIMTGWKTWTGSAIMIIAAGLRATGYESYAEILTLIGGALGLVGLGHKLEKN